MSSPGKASQPVQHSPKASKKAGASLPYPISIISQKEESNLEPENSTMNVRGEMNILAQPNPKQMNMEEDGSHVNVDKIQEFAEAWKSESNFSILLIEKLSLIVNNYFKMLNQMGQRNQEIEILIVYNKSLIEILHKFEDQERKLIQKVRTMEEFNLKIMKELCSLKKRQFNPPEVKTEQSIFAKFSLKNLKYDPPVKQLEKPNQKYEQKIENLFKQYLLQKTDHFLPTVEQKIEGQKALLAQKENLQASSSIQLKIESNLEDLKQLRENIIMYNNSLEHVDCENMFDLYELKCEIKNQLKNLDLDLNLDQESENREKMFVNDVKKIHAGLSSMNEGELQNYLKKQKEIRKKIKKQRVKEQEVFLRACEEAQNENLELKEDIRKLKERILGLEDQLSHAKAEMEFKSMKRGKNNSNLDESSMVQTELKAPTKKLRLDMENKKLKQEIDRLSKMMEAFQDKYEKEKKIIFERLRTNNMQVQQGMTCVEMMELFAIYYDRLSKMAEQGHGGLLEVPEEREDGLLSPRLENAMVLGFNPNNTVQFIKSDSQKQESGAKNLEKTERLNSHHINLEVNSSKAELFEKQIQQLKTMNSQLTEKLAMAQRLCKEVQQKLKALQAKLDQQSKTITQAEERQKDFKGLEAKHARQLAIKQEAIRQLTRQASDWKEEKEKLLKQIKQLQFQNQCAERLANKILKTVQVLASEDISSDRFLIQLDKMMANLQKHVDDYRTEIKKDRDFEKLEEFAGYSNEALGAEGASKLDRNQQRKEVINVKVTRNLKQSHDADFSLSVKSNKKDPDLIESLKKEKPDRLDKKQGTPNQQSSQAFMKKQVTLSGGVIKNVSEGINESILIKGEESNSQHFDKKDSVIFKSNENQERGKARNKRADGVPPQKAQKMKEQKLQKQLKIDQEGHRRENQIKMLEESIKSQKASKRLKSEKNQKGQKGQRPERGEKLDKGQNGEKGKAVHKNTVNKIDSKAEPLSTMSPSKELKSEIEKKNLDAEEQQRNQGSRIALENQSKMMDKGKKGYQVVVKGSSEQAYRVKVNSPIMEPLKQSKEMERIHPLSFMSSSSRHRGEQSSMVRSEKNQRGDSMSESRPPEMNEVNLSLSDDEQELEEELGIQRNSYLHTNKRNISRLDRSAVNAGIELIVVEKMFQKFQRLCNDDDALDFYELFQRYKEALKCLEKSEQLNKLHQIRYQKYIESVKNKQKCDPSYKMETRLLFLERQVLNQEEQLLRQKEEFESSVIEQIKISEHNIGQHLKLMRREYEARKRMGL